MKHGTPPVTVLTPAPAPYTAEEAAAFVRLGACFVALPPGEEAWRDPLACAYGEGGKDLRSASKSTGPGVEAVRG